jgi:polyphenol oxidase
MMTLKPVLLRPEIFESTVTAAFTTRHGGASENPYDSLNLGLSTGDRPETVLQNRLAVFSQLGFRSDDVAVAGQVHGKFVQVVEKGGLYKQTDGLVTTQPGVLLAISAADCAAVLLADAENHVIGACHAGWRGAVAGIVERTVGIMMDLGADVSDIRAYVSPCISSDRFQVGPEVAAEFDKAFVRPEPGTDRSYVNLKGDIRRRLETAGIPAEHIEISGHCTMTAVGDFFSHRAENGATGRMMGLIGMPKR